MGCKIPVEIRGNQCSPTVSSYPASLAARGSAPYQVAAVVAYDEKDVLRIIEPLRNLDCLTTLGDVTAVRVPAIDAVNQGLSTGIGFDAEGPAAVPVRPQLPGIEGLNLPDNGFHRIDHAGAVGGDRSEGSTSAARCEAARRRGRPAAWRPPWCRQSGDRSRGAGSTARRRRSKGDARDTAAGTRMEPNRRGAKRRTGGFMAGLR